MHTHLRTVCSGGKANFYNLYRPSRKNWVAVATLFNYFVFFNIHNHIHTVHSSISTVRTVTLFLIDLVLSGEKNLPEVPSRAGIELGPALQAESIVTLPPPFGPCDRDIYGLNQISSQ